MLGLLAHGEDYCRRRGDAAAVFEGDNLRLRNNHAELIITLDVGPRVISYRTTDGANVFKTFEKQLGGTGESE